MAAGTCNASSRARDKGTSEARWPACPTRSAPGSMGDCLRKQARDDTEETLMLTSAHRHTHAHTQSLFVMFSTEWWGHTLYVPRVSTVKCCRGQTGKQEIPVDIGCLRLLDFDLFTYLWSTSGSCSLTECPSASSAAPASSPLS